MTESATIDAARPSRGGSAAPVLPNFVGGRWVESQARESLDVHNPATGDVIARTPLSTAQDLDAAVQAA